MHVNINEIENRIQLLRSLIFKVSDQDAENLTMEIKKLKLKMRNLKNKIRKDKIK